MGEGTGALSRREFIAAAASGCMAFAAAASQEPGLGALPIEQTRYCLAGLRLEARTGDQVVRDRARRCEVEYSLAEAGVQARWIQVVGHTGSPLIATPHLPCIEADPAGNEQALREWVEDIHEAGMAAVSWFAAGICQSGWEHVPEWRQVPACGASTVGVEGIMCCLIGPYGQALARYCVEAIERLGLDGVWFDGAVLTPIWTQPYGLSCSCAHCRAAFDEATGLPFPETMDWGAPAYLGWVNWRFRAYADAIRRIASAIREAHPTAVVALNHYHRPGIPWRSAVPIDRFDADIVSSSEGFATNQTDLIVRLCRAYGRSQAEVWRNLAYEGAEESDTHTNLVEHALVCYQAGGRPAFGGPWGYPETSKRCAALGPVVNALGQLAGGESLSRIAIHVSQQTETFYFSAADDDRGTAGPYWASLEAWTASLRTRHMPPDYLFDADLRPERIARYDCLLMPLSVALTEEQVDTALQFAREGGVLVLGVAAGSLDEVGQPRGANPLARALGIRSARPPSAHPSSAVPVQLSPASGGRPMTLRALRAPFESLSSQWEPLCSDESGQPAAAMRRYGRGTVIALDLDVIDHSLGYSRVVADGDTEMTVTDETVASGRYSLRCVDGPAATHSFCPDLENRFAAFSVPEHAGGRFSVDLRVDAASRVCVELRAWPPEVQIGPSVVVGPGGVVRAGGVDVCTVPLDAWAHYVVEYAFARDGRPASWRLRVEWDGGAGEAAGLSMHNPDYARTDWLVIFGAGTEPAMFYVDNIALDRVLPDGSRAPVLALDFERGAESLAPAADVAGLVAERLAALAPPPISVASDGEIRLGAFARDGRTTLVHLHNLGGRAGDWLQRTGPAVTLGCARRVRSARLPLTGDRLAVRPHDGRWEITVPPIGLYQVVEIRH